MTIQNWDYLIHHSKYICRTRIHPVNPPVRSAGWYGAKLYLWRGGKLTHVANFIAETREVYDLNPGDWA